MTETPPAATSQELQVSPHEGEPSTPLLETDYDAIAAAVMETDRGRWFLQEYARRNRNADTHSVLSAIDKLEKRISENDSSPKQATSVALLSHDLIDLAGAISQVKKEVAELGGQGNDPDHFNSATVELEAIVEQTESATSEILEAAEKIQEVTWVLREEGASETQCDIIESKIVEVYTACSFQDLTGQRSNKVVQLVGYVERRIASMMSILGLSEEAIGTSAPTRTDQETAEGSAPGLTPEQRNDSRPDADLLNGPAITGEGNEQGEVDALFDEVMFNEAPDFGTDTPSLTEADLPPKDGDDEGLADQSMEDADLGFDAIDPSLTPAEEEEVSDDIEALDVADVAEDDAADAAAQIDDIQTDETAGASQNADVFSSDVYGDAQLVEIHDAEILNQPAEEALVDSAVGQQPKQDIFEIDPLSFGGDNFGGDADNSMSGDVEAETDGAPKMVMGLPGDFDVDSHVADMFVGSGENAPASTKENPTPNDEAQELVDGQDIFEADSVDISSSEDADTEMADTPGSEDTQDDAPTAQVDESDNHELGAQDPVSEVASLEPEDQAPNNEVPHDDANSSGDADDLEVVEAAHDEDAIDEAFVATEAALDIDEVGDIATTDDGNDVAVSEDVELDINEPEPVADVIEEDDETDIPDATGTADDLMQQALAATTSMADETEYPDDEYTVEERIALFS